MRGIYILSEGSTEEEFINNVIRPYLTAQGIYDVRCILMQTSPGHKGGDVTYARYKHNAENLLKREKDVLITSLIDFYKLRTDFPQYSSSLTITDKIKESHCWKKPSPKTLTTHDLFLTFSYMNWKDYSFLLQMDLIFCQIYQHKTGKN